MGLPARLPPFPENFSKLQLEKLRTMSATLSGASTLRTLFPTLDDNQRKAFSNFIHDKSDLDYNQGREKIAILFETCYRRLSERAFKKLAVSLGPLITAVYSSGAGRFADLSQSLHDAYDVDGVSTRRDREQLPGAYFAYRTGEAADGAATIVKSAVLIEAVSDSGTPHLEFKITYPQTFHVGAAGGTELHGVEGIVLPKGKHLHFLGRDEAFEAPFHIITDRPDRKPFAFSGLFTRVGTASLAVSARLLLIRQEHSGDLPPRVYQRLLSGVGIFPAAGVADELAGLDWALDNSVGDRAGNSRLWQADLAMAVTKPHSNRRRRASPKVPVLSV